MISFWTFGAVRHVVSGFEVWISHGKCFINIPYSDLQFAFWRLASVSAWRHPYSLTYYLKNVLSPFSHGCFMCYFALLNSAWMTKCWKLILFNFLVENMSGFKKLISNISCFIYLSTCNIDLLLHLHAIQVKIGLRVLTRPLPSQLPTIYRTLGEKYNERVLPSIIHETLKAVVAQYNASQLITQREVRSKACLIDAWRRKLLFK